MSTESEIVMVNEIKSRTTQVVVPESMVQLRGFDVAESFYATSFTECSFESGVKSMSQVG